VALLGMETLRGAYETRAKDLDGDDGQPAVPRRRRPSAFETGEGARGPALTVTVEEAARLLGISRTLAYELVTRDELPHLRLGRRIVVSRRALELLVDGALGQASGPVAHV
jgi:excisionase family DNA binding protein